MGVDHGGADVFVAEELLDGANVVAGFEEMGGKAVAEGMAAGWLLDAGGDDGLFDGVLEVLFGEVVPTSFAAARVE